MPAGLHASMSRLLPAGSSHRILSPATPSMQRPAAGVARHVRRCTAFSASSSRWLAPVSPAAQLQRYRATGEPKLAAAVVRSASSGAASVCSAAVEVRIDPALPWAIHSPTVAILAPVFQIGGVDAAHIRSQLSRRMFDHGAHAPALNAHLVWLLICPAGARTEDGTFPVCGAGAQVAEVLGREQDVPNTRRSGHEQGEHGSLPIPAKGVLWI